MGVSASIPSVPDVQPSRNSSLSVWLPPNNVQPSTSSLQLNNLQPSMSNRNTPYVRLAQRCTAEALHCASQGSELPQSSSSRLGRESISAAEILRMANSSARRRRQLRLRPTTFHQNANDVPPKMHSSLERQPHMILYLLPMRRSKSLELLPPNITDVPPVRRRKSLELLPLNITDVPPVRRSKSLELLPPNKSQLKECP